MQDGSVDSPQSKREKDGENMKLQLDPAPGGDLTMQSAGCLKDGEDKGRALAMLEEAEATGLSSKGRRSVLERTEGVTEAQVLGKEAQRVEEDCSELNGDEQDEAPSPSSSSAAPSHSFPSPGDVFSTKAAFFSACQPPSNASEYKYYPLTDSAKRAAVACRGRQQFSCSFKVTALLGDEGWVVAGNSCCFEHKHVDKEAEEILRIATKQRGGDGQRTSSHEEDPLVKERRKMEQIQLERDQQAFPGEIPVASPELPKFGDRFASFEVALLTLRALVIPITGVGFSPTPESKVSRSAFCNRGGSTYMEARRCGFKIVFRLDSTDDMWVVSKDSFFSHNHGRDRRIIEDPKWRPRSKGGGPYDEAEDLEKIRKFSNPPSPSSSSSLEDEDDHGSSSDEASFPSPEPALMRKSPYSPPQSYKKQRLSSIDRPLAASPPKIESKPPRPQQLGAISKSSSPSSPAPHLRPIQDSHATPKATRNLQETSNTPFSRQLALFLALLHPSLESTSAILFDAGVKDLSLLVAFVSMEESMRDRFLGEVKLPLLQKALLKKGLRSAEASWKAEK